MCHLVCSVHGRNDVGDRVDNDDEDTLTVCEERYTQLYDLCSTCIIISIAYKTSLPFYTILHQNQIGEVLYNTFA